MSAPPVAAPADLARASLLEVIAHLDAAFAAGAPTVTIAVLDPDLARGRYAGEPVEVAGEVLVHRPLRAWLDLAERRGWRLRTPRPLAAPRLALTFERLDRGAALGPAIAAWERGGAPGAPAGPPGERERYGAASPFARIKKHEDPGFVLDLAEALARVAPGPAARVLDLGVNTGDELALLPALCPALADATFVGVDHSASALAACRARLLPALGDRLALHEADAHALGALGLGRFDLVVSIGTLQSGGIDDRAVLRALVQDHLAAGGAVILGVPNCRYVDGEVEHGARMKNFRQPELGLLVKDVAFYRKYLQQHAMQVFVTGKHYVLVTAVPAAGR